MVRKDHQDKKNASDTPRTKTQKLLRTFTKKDVKISLVGYQVLLESLRKKYKDKRASSKADIRKSLCNRTIKKYRLKTQIYEIGIRPTRHKTRKTGYNSLTKRIAEKVHQF
ncbi:hypothetical protein DPMN_042842 [Dreissena polymorpha]|uniref:Uncharacterized protein n=1 Tax=Dreissena polymorpha TaxID=45954 RepID=A0A9D4D1R6_DREPO|nr:hypothetical protein DPMN_042842 [Dreissena polymorpha]